MFLPWWRNTFRITIKVIYTLVICQQNICPLPKLRTTKQMIIFSKVHHCKYIKFPLYDSEIFITYSLYISMSTDYLLMLPIIYLYSIEIEIIYIIIL